MPADEVFVDTSALLALINIQDDLYSKAAAINSSLAKSKIPLVTSDWVLSEFLSGAARPSLRPAALRMISALKSSSRTAVVEANRDAWDRAYAFYATHMDKHWSLVDCSSMLICKDRQIRSDFTNDRHFAQFGLAALLRS